MYISKFMTMAQLMREHPELVGLLDEIGLGCSKCISRVTDTIKIAAEKHGLTLDELLIALREKCAASHDTWNKPQ